MLMFWMLAKRRPNDMRIFVANFLTYTCWRGLCHSHCPKNVGRGRWFQALRKAEGIVPWTWSFWVSFVVIWRQIWRSTYGESGRCMEMRRIGVSLRPLLVPFLHEQSVAIPVSVKAMGGTWSLSSSKAHWFPLKRIISNRLSIVTGYINIFWVL